MMAFSPPCRRTCRAGKTKKPPLGFESNTHGHLQSLPQSNVHFGQHFSHGDRDSGRLGRGY